MVRGGILRTSTQQNTRSKTNQNPPGQNEETTFIRITEGPKERFRATKGKLKKLKELSESLGSEEQALKEKLPEKVRRGNGGKKILLMKVVSKSLCDSPSVAVSESSKGT